MRPALARQPVPDCLLANATRPRQLRDQTRLRAKLARQLVGRRRSRFAARGRAGRSEAEIAANRFRARRPARKVQINQDARRAHEFGAGDGLARIAPCAAHRALPRATGLASSSLRHHGERKSRAGALHGAHDSTSVRRAARSTRRSCSIHARRRQLRRLCRPSSGVRQSGQTSIVRTRRVAPAAPRRCSALTRASPSSCARAATRRRPPART